MKNFAVMLIAFFAIPLSVFADGAASLSAYAIPATSTARDPQLVTGIYTYLGYDAYSIELEYDKVSTTTTNGGQQNAVFVFSNHATPYTHLRFGINQVQPDNGKLASVVIFGAMFDQYNYYGVLDTKMGADFYASFHNDNGRKITVFQIDPTITHYFGSTIIPGWLSITSKARIQSLSESLGYGTFLTSGEFVIKDDLYPLSITAKLWAGGTQFGVYEDGFAVYNNSDYMSAGALINLGFAISSQLSLNVGYQSHLIQLENESSRDQMSKTMVMVSYRL